MQADVGIIKLNSAEDWKEESSHCKRELSAVEAVVALVDVGEGDNTGQPQVAVVGRLALPPRLLGA